MSVTKAYAAQGPDTPLAPFQIDRREVLPQDVKIEILYCGVCHSDLHMVRNEWKQTIYPIVPGHEIVGKVTAVGNKASKFKRGDVAGVGVMVDSDRVCVNCKKGLEQYCKSGMVGTYSARKGKGRATFGRTQVRAHERWRATQAAGWILRLHHRYRFGKTRLQPVP